MTNIEHRIKKLEDKANPKGREIWVVYGCNKGENPERKQMEALKTYNEEHGTTLTEDQVNWLAMVYVGSRGGLPPTE